MEYVFRGQDQLLQLLYYKFYLHYLFIVPVATPIENEAEGTIDVTRVRFRFRKCLLYLVLPFRRVYLISALGLNLIADALTYVATSNLSFAVLVGVILELTRRLLKL